MSIIKKINVNGVEYDIDSKQIYIGNSQPTDENIVLWVDTTGGAKAKINNQWVELLGGGEVQNPDADCKAMFIKAMQDKMDKMGVDIKINGMTGWSDDRTDVQYATAKDMAKVYAYACGYDDLCKVWNTSKDKRIVSKGDITTEHLLHSSVFSYGDGSHYANHLTDYYDLLGGKTGSLSSTGFTTRTLGAIVKGPAGVALAGWVRRQDGDTSSHSRFSAMKALVDIAYALIDNPQADISDLETALVATEGATNACIIKVPTCNTLLYKKSNLTKNPDPQYDTYIYSYNGDTKVGIASNTKVLNVITALDYIDDLNEIVTLIQSDVSNQTGGSDATPGLSQGEKFTVREILYLMMMPSSNKAAQALGRFVGNKLINMGYQPESDWTLSSISILQQPTKTVYNLFDTLDTKGMIVRGAFSKGGRTTTETLQGWTCFPTTFDTTGTKPITVSYKYGEVTKTATFSVTVNETKTLDHIGAVYTQGSSVVYPDTSLDKLRDNLVVTAYYTEGSPTVITNYTLSGTLSVGTSTITAAYQNKTATFNVTVSEPQWRTGYVTVGNPTIDSSTNKITTSDGNFIKTSFTFDNQNAPWEIRTKATYDKPMITEQVFYDLIGFVDENNNSVRGALIEINQGPIRNTQNINLWLSNNNSSWNIYSSAEVQNMGPDISLLNGKDIYVRYGWTGTKYYMEVSEYEDVWDGTYRFEYASTTNIMTGYALAVGNKRQNAWGDGIYLEETKLFIDGEPYWKAM